MQRRLDKSDHRKEEMRMNEDKSSQRSYLVTPTASDIVRQNAMKMIQVCKKHSLRNRATQTEV